MVCPLFNNNTIDALAAGLTNIDIIEADVPFSNKAKAFGINVAGIFGIVGSVPTPTTMAVGAAIDVWSVHEIEELLTPQQ